ncbi:DUF4261 domain-containing protein [Anaeromicrobium sediminis]|nr:DUF4261 domain-containing protein [Anaeromicrobium sediminis]
MGLLEKFFGKRKKRVKESEKVIEDSQPAISLIFNELPIIDSEVVGKRIEEIESLKGSVHITLDKELNDGENILSVIEFDDHKIKLVGFNGPLPSNTINHTVNCSYWKPDEKEVMRNHKAHIICYYHGKNSDPIEKYIALYKVAYAFMENGLIGLINEDAWTCNLAYVIDDLMNEGMLEECRNVPPLLLWTNLVKMPTESGTWMFTKGNHIFGVNDFAYKGDMSKASEVNEIFNNIFYYIYENKVNVEVGHTLQIKEDVYLKFEKVTEEKEYIEGPLGTLVIERINPNDINSY